MEGAAGDGRRYKAFGWSWVRVCALLGLQGNISKTLFIQNIHTTTVYSCVNNILLQHVFLIEMITMSVKSGIMSVHHGNTSYYLGHVLTVMVHTVTSEAL